MTFKPQTLTVRRGDRVIWVNRDLLAHTATATGGATAAGADTAAAGSTSAGGATAAGRQFDSQEIKPDASWSWVAAGPGTFPYVCAFHPTMHGKLVVQ